MIFKNLVDYLMPPRCMDCHEITDEEFLLCAHCWKDYVFINEPLCKICGLPFEIQIDSLCLGCLHKKPPFSIARSIFKYNEKSKKLIHNFKYHDKTYLSKFFAKMLLSKYKDIIVEADLITCVPMHRLKRIFRMYNQSHLIAKDLSINSNKPFIPDILSKVKYSKSQTFFSRNARKTNLKNTILCTFPEQVLGKKILLIDDVITTGETIKLCARELKKAGAKEIFILSIAKNYR